jgi:hypothetical protein
VAEQGLLVLSLVVAAVSLPYALLSAAYLAGADETANSAGAALLGVLLVPASVLSVMAVLALVRGAPSATTTLVLLAPALTAAVAGPFGGPRSMHRSTPFTGDVVTG